MKFKKGPGGNRKGRRPYEEEYHLAKLLNRREFQMIASKYLLMPKEEFNKALVREDLPMVDFMVCSIIHKGIKAGDQQRLNMLLDRTIGKVVEKVDLTIEGSVKVEHLKSYEIRTILAADPFIKLNGKEQHAEIYGAVAARRSEGIEVEASGEGEPDPGALPSSTEPSD